MSNTIVKHLNCHVLLGQKCKHVLFSIINYDEITFGPKKHVSKHVSGTKHMQTKTTTPTKTPLHKKRIDEHTNMFVPLSISFSLSLSLYLSFFLSLSLSLCLSAFAPSVVVASSAAALVLCFPSCILRWHPQCFLIAQCCVQMTGAKNIRS